MSSLRGLLFIATVSSTEYRNGLRVLARKDIGTGLHVFIHPSEKDFAVTADDSDEEVTNVMPTSMEPLVFVPGPYREANRWHT